MNKIFSTYMTLRSASLAAIFFAVFFLCASNANIANAQEADPWYAPEDSEVGSDPWYQPEVGGGAGVSDPWYQPESDPWYAPSSDPWYTPDGGQVSDPWYAPTVGSDPWYAPSSDPYGASPYSNPSNPYYSNDWTPGCGNACIGPTSSAYGTGGTQGYGNGWGIPYNNYGNYRGNYGYTPVYGMGGTQYAAASYPMYQQPQYAQPTYQQPVQNYQMTWGNINTAPVLYSKSIGTSVPLFGTYPSCVIYFLPTASPYTHGLRWSGINIAQATMSYVGQVTGEGYMEVPFDGRQYSLTVWNDRGETTTCSTR